MKPTVIRVHEADATLREAPRFRLKRDGAWADVTWGDCDAAFAEVGVWLAQAGLSREQAVCVFAPNRVEWLYAGFGIQAAGGAMVPIYPSNTAEQAGYVIRHSDAFAVFVDTQPLLERVLVSGAVSPTLRLVLLGEGHDLDAAEAAAVGAGVSLPEAWRANVTTLPALRAEGRAKLDAEPGTYDALLDQIRREHRCLMLYTSGTTGNPKGVPLTYENVNSSSEDWIETLGKQIPEEPVDLFWLPMSHIFGWGEASLGFELEFLSYLTNPAEVLGLFDSIRPSVFMSVPAYWEKLARGAMAETDPEKRKARLRADTGGRLHFCLSGGAGLERKVKEAFEEAGLLIIEGYGLTEASPTITMNQPDRYRFDSVGLPFPRVQLKLAEDGEILVKGPNVFSGYHKDPEATAKTFDADGWLLTGDLGRLTEDGFLQIIGRKKEILVTAGGKNVPPANIENLFVNDDLIEHLVVYGDGKKYLVAGVWVTEKGKKMAPDALDAEVTARIEAANGRLAKHETIKKHRIIEAPLTVEGGMLTPTLKLRRKNVYGAFGNQLEELYA